MVLTSRYSQHARRALFQARLLAQDYHHEAVDTDHLLIGIMREKGSLGSQVLGDLVTDMRRAELEVRVLHAVGDWLTFPLDLTGGLRRVLSLSVDEANWFGHHYIGTEHLLLALLRGAEGRAPDLLRILDISSEQIRRRVRLLLSDGITEIGIEATKRKARLSELSRRVLNAAEQVAQGAAQTTQLEHLLLMLAQERRSMASRILHENGLDQMRLQAAVDVLAQENKKEQENILEEVIDCAMDRAGQLGTHYTGTDHILLALTQIDQGKTLLHRFGADPGTVQAALYRHLVPPPD